MFEFDFGSGGKKASETKKTISGDYADIERLHLVHWQEHCVECSAPSCFRSCALYSRRADMMCARFKAGITADAAYPSVTGYAANITFKRWGKLETNLRGSSASIRQLRILTTIDLLFSKLVGLIGKFLNPITRLRKVNTHIVYAKFRKWFLRALSHCQKSQINDYDLFRLDVFYPENRELALLFELNGIAINYKTALKLKQGVNRFDIPVSEIRGKRIEEQGQFGVSDVMRLYPENDQEANIVIQCAYFLKFKQKRTTDRMIKVVVWDLDHTIWNGILVEEDPASICLRSGIKVVIEGLDERGVLQSIASKNNHEAVWPVLERLQISQYFLSPVINWQAKSGNIRNIAASLNLGLDSILFVDDSAVERSEVLANAPLVAVVDEIEALSLLKRPDMPQEITDESRQRRKLYQLEEVRKTDHSNFSNHIEFLRSCELKATVFTPLAEEHQERCVELMKRTNQFNISKRIITTEELQKLIASNDCLIEAIECSDRYGNYGVVGLIIIQSIKDKPVVTDFILSCRVAKKYVEHAWFQSIILRFQQNEDIHLVYKQTERNRVLYATLKEIGFFESALNQESVIMKINKSHTVPNSDVVDIA
jgi:FkbH-like protein